MRYALSFVLLLCACTKANPDASPITSGDLAAPPVGSGGGGSAHDLAPPSPAHDMSPPADLATPAGIACGMMTCSDATPYCCYDSNGPHCTDPNGCTGFLATCDGPEDCSAATPTCCLEYANGGNTRPTGTACAPACPAPLCHTVDDCPQDYVACCPYRTGSTFKHCSNFKCM